MGGNVSNRRSVSMTLLLGGALAACGGADGSAAAGDGAEPAPMMQEGAPQLASHTVHVYKTPD